MNPELVSALQTQMNVERFNSAMYYALAEQMEVSVWDGTAKFFHKSALDELEHSKKFASHLVDRNVTPILESVPAAKGAGITSMVVAIKAAYELEVATTKKINALYALSDELDDPQTCVFLHWFIEEQTRSVREMYDMLIETQRAGTDVAALMELDEKYGKA